MSGWLPFPGRRRAAELRAALAAVEALSAEVDGLRSEIEDVRMENDLLAHSVLIDGDTGLANAAAFELDHLQLDARRRRAEQPYSVLLAQIDDPSDADNVIAGTSDPRLPAVAEVFKASVRKGDRAYRWDHNRLAVLLSGADLKRAVAAGERFRSRVEDAARGPLGQPGPGDRHGRRDRSRLSPPGTEGRLRGSGGARLRKLGGSLQPARLAALTHSAPPAAAPLPHRPPAT